MKFFYETENNKCSRGFSLVELMVSMSVFSVVIVITLGTLLVMIDINAKAQALFSSTTNLSFALDSISREIRTGFDYYCIENPSHVAGAMGNGNARDCQTDPGYGVGFTREKDGTRFVYLLNGDELERHDGSDWMPITSNNDVVVSNFAIDVQNTSNADQMQPTAEIYIDGFMYNGLDTETAFNVQTKITQRRFDI